MALHAVCAPRSKCLICFPPWTPGSKSRHALGSLAYRRARRMEKRIARNSQLAMRRACAGPCEATATRVLYTATVHPQLVLALLPL
jgi:hypothetical protein